MNSKTITTKDIDICNDQMNTLIDIAHKVNDMAYEIVRTQQLYGHIKPDYQIKGIHNAKPIQYIKKITATEIVFTCYPDMRAMDGEILEEYVLPRELFTTTDLKATLTRLLQKNVITQPSPAKSNLPFTGCPRISFVERYHRNCCFNADETTHW